MASCLPYSEHSIVTPPHTILFKPRSARASSVIAYFHTAHLESDFVAQIAKTIINFPFNKKCIMLYIICIRYRGIIHWNLKYHQSINQQETR